jgi:hypothetical protein
MSMQRVCATLSKMIRFGVAVEWIHDANRGVYSAATWYQVQVFCTTLSKMLRFGVAVEWIHDASSGVYSVARYLLHECVSMSIALTSARHLCLPNENWWTIATR